MARPVDETEWLTRTTTPLRLVRHAQTRIPARAKLLLAVAACRRVALLLRSDDSRHDLDLAEGFARGAVTAEAYAVIRSVATRGTQRPNGEDVSPEAAATLAVTAARAGNVTAGLPRVFEWVLRAGQDDPKLPAALCDLVREIAGNPFRPWHVQPDWLNPGGRVAPDGSTVAVPESALALAKVADERADFGLLPVLADELEQAGWADADFLNHLRHGKTHERGCWALDVVLGRG